jgi:hypothetical protein
VELTLGDMFAIKCLLSMSMSMSIIYSRLTISEHLTQKSCNHAECGGTQILAPELLSKGFKRNCFPSLTGQSAMWSTVQ